MIQTIRLSAKYFSSDYRKAVELILSHSSVEHRTKVTFALYCASDEAVENSYDRNKHADIYNLKQQCLKLVEQWLKDSTLVTDKQLREAAAAAYAAANAANAANAAHAAAAHAAAAAYAAANAAYAAANAADVAAAYAAAAAAAYAAANAAYAAANAADVAAAYAAANAAYTADADAAALKKKHYLYLIKLVLGNRDSWLTEYVMKSIETKLLCVEEHNEH